MIVFTVSSHFFHLTSCSPWLVYDMMFKEMLRYHIQQTSPERNWLVINNNCKTNPTINPAFGHNLCFLGAEVKQHLQLLSVMFNPGLKSPCAKVKCRQDLSQG